MIKMFRMVSGEIIIAEVLEDTEICYTVKYPAIMFTAGDNMMIQALPQFAKHFADLMNKFEIPKRLVFFSDEAEDGCKEIYEQFTKRARQQITGIIEPDFKVQDKRKLN